MNPKSLRRRTLRLTLSIAALSILLAACGSGKPGVSEIEKTLAVSYRCTPFEVSNVKKTNGIPVSDNLHELAFTYQLEYKGGVDGAVAYYSKMQRLKNDNADRRTEMETLRFGGCTGTNKGPFILNPGNGTTSHIDEIVWDRLKAGSGPISIPSRILMSGAARARQTDNGWQIFEGRMPDIEQVEDSAPVLIER